MFGRTPFFRSTAAPRPGAEPDPAPDAAVRAGRARAAAPSSWTSTPSPAPLPAPTLAPGAAKPAVLIVDDEPFIRMAAADTLGDAGLTPFEAADAGEALDLLSGHPEIALLVTDVNMPGMDGVALARRVRGMRPDLGIILTSGRRAILAPELPARAEFLAKPYGARQLLAAIFAKLGLAGA
jgi:CheY-like chemotaxis protein